MSPLFTNSTTNTTTSTSIILRAVLDSEYFVRVFAQYSSSSISVGVASDPVSILSVYKPNVPTSATLRAYNDKTLYFSWSPPTVYTGRLTSYRVEYSTLKNFTNSVAKIVSSSTLYVKIEQLVTKTLYYTRVAAINSAGQSSWASVTTGVAPALVSPDPPTSVRYEY